LQIAHSKRYESVRGEMILDTMTGEIRANTESESVYVFPSPFEEPLRKVREIERSTLSKNNGSILNWWPDFRSWKSYSEPKYYKGLTEEELRRRR